MVSRFTPTGGFLLPPGIRWKALHPSVQVNVGCRVLVGLFLMFDPTLGVYPVGVVGGGV